MTRRTLVFDVGGVIVRWQPLHLIQQFLPQQAPDERSARAVAADVFQGHAPGDDWAEYDLGRIEPDALAQRIAARTGYAVPSLRALIAAVPEHIQPMPASVALLERLLAAGHRLTLLSNMPVPNAAHLEAHHACIGWFEARVYSGRVGMMKPYRAMFDYAFTALGLDLDHMLFIDDNAVNIDVARGLGWPALCFESAAQCEADLRRDGWL